MESKLQRCTFLLFNFAFLMHLTDNCNGVVLIISDAGRSLNTSGEILSTIGKKQCVRECMRRGDCLSVNYWRSELRCQLNPSTVGPGVALVSDPACLYLEKAAQSQDLLSGPCSSYACADKCSELSSGTTSCMAVYGASTTTTTNPTTATTGPMISTTIPTTTTISTTTTTSSTTTTTTSPTTTTTSPTTTTTSSTTTTTTSPTTTTTSPTTTTTSPTTTTTTSPTTTTTSSTTTTTTSPTTTTTSPTTTTTSSTTTTTTSPTTTTTSPTTTTTSSTTTTTTSPTTTTTSPTTTTTSPTTTIFTTTTTTAPITSTTLATTSFGGTTGCPSLFVWNPFVNLCYKVEEVPLLWQDAKVHCESKGSRLAILNIPPKLDVISADSTAGLLLNYQYYIGSSYDTFLTEWKWVDGLIVDPVFLMNYLVTGGAGNCLVWDNVYGLSDVPCSATRPFICEVPVSTAPPPTSLPPMTSSTAPTTIGLPTTTNSGSNCPPTFTLNPSINLCYHVVEISMLWLDAKLQCESMGARLAVLDTPGKLDAILNDYFGGLLLSYNYFVGADFDDVALEYKWVTNVLVDSTGFLSNYPVTRVTGHCLMWSDIDLLRNIPCTNPLPSICEIPVGVPTSATTAPSCPYIWKPEVSLCYNNVEDTHKWSEGNTTCTNSGKRLAILNTQGKLSAVMNDYTVGGILLSSQYHIGGRYVSGIGWEWVDGAPVDPTFLAYYGITSVDGDCLLWDSINLLVQDQCDRSLRILCETVMSQDSA